VEGFQQNRRPPQLSISIHSRSWAHAPAIRGVRRFGMVRSRQRHCGITDLWRTDVIVTGQRGR
jgi:hypothetical protein